MKKIIAIFLIAFACATIVFANEKQVDPSLEKARKAAQAHQAEHLLDGTSMNYYYQNGGGIHLELYDGMLKYEWIVGPRTGHKNRDLPYKSRKIGERLYMVSWLEESHPDYTTLVFNFTNNVMYSSGIFRFGSKDQFIRFDGGIIENLTLVTK